MSRGSARSRRGRPARDVVRTVVLDDRQPWSMKPLERWLRGTSFGQDVKRSGTAYEVLAGLTTGKVVGFIAVLWLTVLLPGWIARIQDQVAWWAWPAITVWGVLVVAVTVIVSVWWREYDDSHAQTRHTMLARKGVFGSAKAIRAQYGARAILKKAHILRPQFAALVATAGRASAVAAVMFPAQTQEALAAAEAEVAAKWPQEPASKRAKRRFASDLLLARTRAGETVMTSFGRVAVSETGEVLACGLPPAVDCAGSKVQIGDMAFYLGSSRAESVYISIERPIVGDGIARSGKGVNLAIPMILSAPGTVITTSTRPDNYFATALCRAARGPICVFNLDGEGGVPHTARWSILDGCQDAEIAQLYAEMLIAGTGINSGGNKEWGSDARGVVQALLHCGAVGNKSIHEVFAWSRSYDKAREALAMMKQLALVPGQMIDGWQENLAALLREDPKMRSSKWFAVSNAFNCLDLFSLRENMVAHEGQKPFDAEDFLLSGGTCYLISKGAATSGDTAGTIGVIYAMFLDHMWRTASRISQVCPGNRIDPPVTMILDEIANIYPWPSMARVASRGSGQGVQKVGLWQSSEQRVGAYGQHAAKEIEENSARLTMPGNSNAQRLGEIESLLPPFDYPSVSNSVQLGTGVGAGGRNRGLGLGMGGGLFGSRSRTYSTTRGPGASKNELSSLEDNTAVINDAKNAWVITSFQPFYDGPHKDCVEESIAWFRDHPGQTLTSHIHQTTKDGGTAPLDGCCTPAHPSPALATAPSAPDAPGAKQGVIR